ncbi:MAG: adenylate/guanylate cyclase domain-containing protein [Thermoplasmata archaeon]
MASTRRLVAIMFTDMVGYTASVQADESGTLRLLQEEEELVRPLLSAHRGREIKSTGDGFLVEFDSALRAVQCAIDIHRRLHERNAQPGVTPIQVRIGVHLGDIEERGRDIFGDAVNITSRIEAFAEPGGVCVSGAVQEQVRNKIPERLEKLPPTTLKGLQVAMELYRVVLPWMTQEPTRRNPASTGIAVLPFVNISLDPKDDYFADGLTEELITVISQLRELRVTSRTSVMQYKATTKALSQIGFELGVASILEGSVRRAGKLLRITAQLIDARSDGHLWATTFDRELEDVFAVQTEIAKHVAEALKVELLGTQRVSLRPPPTSNIEAYDLFLKGIHLYHLLSRKEQVEAIKFLEDAIRKDASFALAYAYLANAYVGTSGIFVPAGVAFPRAELLVAKALELDPNSSEAHTARANLALQYEQDWKLSEAEFKRAISFNPSSADAHFWYAALLKVIQRFGEAKEELQTTIALDPLWRLPKMQLMIVNLHAGDLETALDLAIRSRDENPALPGRHALVGLVHAAMGRMEEARTEAKLSAGPLKEDNSRWTRAILWAKLGEPKEARLLLVEFEEASKTREVSVAQIAGLHAVLGEKENALERLEREQPKGEGDLWLFYQWMAFDSLRAEPRFQALLKKLNLT